MKININEIKYQTCNLCDALIRNVNDNFESVSFEIVTNGDIQVKVILVEKTRIEEGNVEDMIAEFSAMQQTDCVREPLILVGKNHSPFLNIVYQKE